MSREKGTSYGALPEVEPWLEHSISPKKHHHQHLRIVLLIFALVLAFVHLSNDWIFFTPFVTHKEVATVPDFSHLAAHCAHIPPISSSSFIDRQNALAHTLGSLDVEAYIAEPGASALYFANLSQSYWKDPERPILLVVQPVTDSDHDGSVRANLSIVASKSEKTRAMELEIPSDAAVTFTFWAEDANPFETALALVPNLEGASIVVDDNIRAYIFEGLRKAAPNAQVSKAPVEVKRLRERKSWEELGIMKCVNEVTVLAIRATRQHITFGMRESEVQTLIHSALYAAGLEGPGSIVLFGDDAAFPVGPGTDRVLGKHDFILIDCGGSLHGYHSDVTRTFALADTVIPLRYRAIWQSVHAAQYQAIVTARNNTVTAAVDRAARKVITDAGYGEFFIHPLGHGIGLEEHETPYLRSSSEDVILTGHTFSAEPGIYIKGKVGVRLEDCFYIDEDGSARFLTQGVGGQAMNPWSP